MQFIPYDAQSYHLTLKSQWKTLHREQTHLIKHNTIQATFQSACVLASHYLWIEQMGGTQRHEGLGWCAVTHLRHGTWLAATRYVEREHLEDASLRTHHTQTRFALSH